MTISEIQKAVHQLAKEKGWYAQERSPLELHMLIVSEIAEATEEARLNNDPIYQLAQIEPAYRTPDLPHWDSKIKPEGELIELADAVIRILDYCEHKGFNLESAIMLKHEYNKLRSHRHGNKKY